LAIAEHQVSHTGAECNPAREDVIAGHDGLPIWAKILLGISIDTAPVAKQSETSQTEPQKGASCRGHEALNDDHAARQGDMSYAGRWNWAALLIPVAGEL